MSFPYGARPYLIPLAAQTPSPFGPLSAGRSVATDEKTDPAERPVVTLDAESLSSRVVPVPVPEARYSGLRAVKGGLVWVCEPLAGVLGESAADLDEPGKRGSLERFDFARRECTELVDELDWFDVSGDGTRLVIKDKGELRVSRYGGTRTKRPAA
jgi:tricorn protease